MDPLVLASHVTLGVFAGIGVATAVIRGIEWAGRKIAAVTHRPRTAAHHMSAGRPTATGPTAPH